MLVNPEAKIGYDPEETDKTSSDIEKRVGELEELLKKYGVPLSRQWVQLNTYRTRLMSRAQKSEGAG